MFSAIKNLVDSPAEKSTASIKTLEDRVTAATAKAEAARVAFEDAALAAAEDDNDPEVAAALAKAKQARADALLELDDATAALAAARTRHEKAQATEATARKAEHDRNVRELAEKRIAAAKALHAGAIKFAKLHQAYWDASTEFADALAPSGVRDRQMSLVSADAIARRIQLDLLQLGIRWACKIPISITNVKPFIPTITEETEYLAADACK